MLDGPTFLRLAWRIGSYQGVMRDVLAIQAQEDAGEAQPTGRPRSVDPVDAPGVLVADTAMLLSHPAFRPMPGEAPTVAVTAGG